MLKHINIFLLVSVFVFVLQTDLHAQLEHTGQKAIGTPHNPKVKMSWNRYHTFNELKDFYDRLQKAYPNLVKVASIGKSFQGRDIYALTITDFQSGDHDKKPALFIQGNIHANELQGGEYACYTAWYLVENFADNNYIQTLLKEKTFYILPNINPDGRENFMTAPNNPNSPRSGLVPMDDDGDWEIDEDGFDDLDGDGHITMMRRKDPNGRWKQDPDYPARMTMARPGEAGEYEMLGYEGIDRDGDGRVNEDRTGYYDPNRDWGWNWQPDYVQGGAMKYPFSLPENFAVKEFLLKHRNIIAAQSHHNYGGMFLRGPGAEEDQGSYDRADIAVYDLLGKHGENVVPGYNYLIAYKDLYTVFGGDVDYFHGGIGAFGFVNEIMTSYHLFNNKDRVNRWQDTQFFEFDQKLLFGDGYVEWKSFNHPQFGEIEIGGPKKNYIRNTPGFLMEQEAHRLTAFALFHAFHTPKLEIQDINVKDLPGGLKEVTVTVANTRAMPTHTSHDIKNKITRPDKISINGAQVISGMILSNADFNLGKEQIYDPANMMVSNIGGMSTVKIKWITKKPTGKNMTITVDSPKGGYHTRQFELE
jgi:hypothetical protein